MKNLWITAFRGFFPGMAALALTACHGIGEGNTLAKLELVPATTNTQAVAVENGGTMRLYQCLRDEVLLIGTFNNGITSNFNSRATWKSSDESVVKVSNRDIPVVSVISGAFAEISTQPYAAGTLIPVGDAGDEADITATFVGLSASIHVVIRKPELKLVPVPFSPALDPMAYTPPASLGPGTQQRLAMIGNFDGRETTGFNAGSINASLNPVLWKLTGGEFHVADEEDDSDFDRWLVPDAANPQAYLNSGGTIRGLVPGGGPYEVAAELSLCPGVTDPDLAPVTTFRVLPFDQTTPLSLGYEAGVHDTGSFTPPTQFTAEDIPSGASQILSVVGNLDADGDGVGDLQQNLANQSRYSVDPRDSGCDTLGLNCLFSSLITASAGSDTVGAYATSTGELIDGYDLVCITDPTNAECTQDADPDVDEVGLEFCFPACQPRLASLEAESPLSGPVVTLTATAYGLSGAPQYVFDCGDGSAPVDAGGNPSTDCDYTGDTGPFTATVRVLDPAGAAVTVNAGATRINLDAVPETNTAPTAALKATPEKGDAPLQVTFSASGSADTDSGDSLKVYEFQPEPGVVIRQPSSTLVWVYLAQPATDPTLVVYDSNGVASAPVSVALTVSGTGGPLYRSARLPLRNIPATPCALEIVPPSATPTEPAFSFPGLRFGAVASFIATKEDDTQDCANDPLIGTQVVTPYMSWTARPAADSDEGSDYVAVRSVRTDYQAPGQVVYLKSPDTDTTVYITATPGANALLQDVDDPAAVSMVVQPCPAETCPP